MECITAKQEATSATSKRPRPQDLGCSIDKCAVVVQTITNNMLITWPATFPVPSDVQENVLLRTVLLPGLRFPGSKKSLAADLRNVPLRWEDLPGKCQMAITKACQAIGVHVKQAMGLRTTVYKGAAWWKFHGKEHLAQAAAEALENDVANFLTAHGVAFETQEQQQAAQKACKGPPAPTPDFLIRSPVSINGQRVRWIEVKHFYGTGTINGLPDWMHTIKIQKQIAKYIAAFGPDGAVILKYGYAESFRERTPQHVQLLDWPW